MNTGNPFLDGLFNSLSSIYRKDEGMLNSDLFTLLNAQSEVFSDIQRRTNQTRDNTYINTADIDTLEGNFGFIIDFPKPPRLNTLTNGDEIYRSMLRSLYTVFQSGSTNAAMGKALDVTLSYLNVDPRTTDAVSEINYSRFFESDSQIELTYNAVHPSGGGVFVDGAAEPEDIIFDPPDMIVTGYNDDTKVISFTGTIDTGTNYKVIYTRDNRELRGSNWINVIDPIETNVSPLALKSGTISTFNEPVFSYWWNTFNFDGDGVAIDEFKIDKNDSSLAWRLPQKSVQFNSPYTDQVLNRTTDFYNLSGLAYDLSIINPVNPDILFIDEPSNYYTDVSHSFTDYYIRYSQNNASSHVSLEKFEGALPKFLKKFSSIEFPSDNFGELDFFESGNAFSLNDPFGSGTKHVWLNVPNVNGKYVLNNSLISPRPFSLHQQNLFHENFENGHTDQFTSSFPSGSVISELVGTPFKDKENDLVLMAPASGVAITMSPVLDAEATKDGNRVQIDFFDALNSGTRTYIDIIRTGTESSDYHRFRFGIDNNALEFQTSLIVVDTIDTKPFGFVETFFPSSGNANYAVNTVPGYELVEGNPNFAESTSSVQMTGTSPFTVGAITPNVGTGTISNADFMEFQYTDDGTGSGRRVTADMSVIKYLGSYTLGGSPFSPPTRVHAYGADTLRLYADGGPAWKFERTFYSNPKFTFPTTFGGTTSIPYETGTNTVQVIRGSGMSFNGVYYPGFLGTHWDTGELCPPGRVSKNTDQSVAFKNMPPQDSHGLRVLSGFDGTVEFHHYMFANLATRQNFIENRPDLELAPIPTPYFYQIFTDPITNEARKIYLNQIPREFKWRKLSVDFGTGHSETEVLIDEAVIFNESDIGFSGNIVSPSGIILSSETDYPSSEFSYFDNIIVSKFDKNNFLPYYSAVTPIIDDWEGSALSESTVIDNKFFEQEPQPNFQFNVIVKGLDESFIFIINQLIERLKPAHTIATSIFQLEQGLDTTSTSAVVINTGTDWESGSIENNIIIKSTGQLVSPTDDLPGYITISGSTP